MTASPTAVELARACVMTVDAGAMRSVRVVPPGTDPRHSIHWITVPADLAARYVEEAVAVLAPFVDLGMARGRLTPEPSTTRPLHTWRPMLMVEEPPRDIAPEVPYTVDDEDDQEID